MFLCERFECHALQSEHKNWVFTILRCHNHCGWKWQGILKFSGILLMFYTHLLYIAVVRQFQEYQEPEEGEDVKSPRRTTSNPTNIAGSAASEEDKVLLPLGETTLTHNLGIPLLVVVTKVWFL